MSLASLVRRVVKTANKVTDTLQAVVTVQRWIGQDVTGAPSYAPAVSWDAVVRTKQRINRMTSGQVIWQVAVVTFPRPIAPLGNVTDRQEPIDPRDKFTLPSGYIGLVLSIEGSTDPGTSAPYAMKVAVGEYR